MVSDSKATINQIQHREQQITEKLQGHLKLGNGLIVSVVPVDSPQCDTQNHYHRASRCEPIQSPNNMSTLSHCLIMVKVPSEYDQKS